MLHSANTYIITIMLLEHLVISVYSVVLMVLHDFPLIIITMITPNIFEKARHFHSVSSRLYCTFIYPKWIDLNGSFRLILHWYRLFRHHAFVSTPFILGSCFLKKKQVRKDDTFSIYFVGYRRFWGYYLSRWNTYFMYWTIMYVLEKNWRGRFIDVEIISTKVQFSYDISWEAILGFLLSRYCHDCAESNASHIHSNEQPSIWH